MSQPSPQPDKDNAGVIAPPPLIFAGVFALALGIDIATSGPSLGLPDQARYIGGLALFLVGIALPLTAATRFRAAGTHVRPWKAATALVTSGIYRYTRNPMYLGMALIYVSFSVFADSVIALILLLPLLAVITYGVISREERYLEVKFGAPYREYKGKVRRWI